MKLMKYGLMLASAGLLVACAATDPTITGSVKTKLAADTVVDASDIDVDTEDGVVTLTGNLDDRAAKERALTIARETSGVKRVVDMLAVRRANGSGDAPAGERTLGEGIDDAGITMAVKSKLLSDPEVKGLQIDVDTRNGVVYLTGEVGSSAEREHAVELAQKTANVRRVEDNLKVGNS